MRTARKLDKCPSVGIYSESHSAVAYSEVFGKLIPLFEEGLKS